MQKQNNKNGNGIYLNTDENKLVLEFDIPEFFLDKDGLLTETFFNIHNNHPMDTNILLSILSFSAISPFFHVLDQVGIIPLILIVPRGMGKSTIMKTFLNKMYGTNMKNSDDLLSMVRMQNALRETITPLYIDDISDGFINQFRISRLWRYKDVSQTGLRFDPHILRAIAISTNSSEGVKGPINEKFRMRSIIIDVPKEIRYHSMEQYQDIKKIKKNNLIFGFYFLNKALEYINASTSLERLYDSTYEMVRHYIEKHKIELFDIRRISIYPLLYMGLSFWQYTFQSKGLHSEILTEILNLDSCRFADYIKSIEHVERIFQLCEYCSMEIDEIEKEKMKNIEPNGYYHSECYKYYVKACEIKEGIIKTIEVKDSLFKLKKYFYGDFKHNAQIKNVPHPNQHIQNAIISLEQAIKEAELIRINSA